MYISIANVSSACFANQARQKISLALNDVINNRNNYFSLLPGENCHCRYHHPNTLQSQSLPPLPPLPSPAHVPTAIAVAIVIIIVVVIIIVAAVFGIAIAICNFSHRPQFCSSRTACKSVDARTHAHTHVQWCLGVRSPIQACTTAYLPSRTCTWSYLECTHLSIVTSPLRIVSTLGRWVYMQDQPTNQPTDRLTD